MPDENLQTGAELDAGAREILEECLTAGRWFDKELQTMSLPEMWPDPPEEPKPALPGRGSKQKVNA